MSNTTMGQPVNQDAELQAAIARLQRTKEAEELAYYNEGLEAGRAWAVEGRNYKMLRRLSKHKDKLGDDWEHVYSDEANSAYSSAERLYFAMLPRDDGYRQAAEEFWKTVLGDDAKLAELADDDDFVRGFADGAIEFWEQVEDQI